MALTENEQRVKYILSNQFETYVKINRMRERAESLEAKGKYDAAETIHEQADHLEIVLEVYEQHSERFLKRDSERANYAYHILSMRNARKEKESTSLVVIGEIFSISRERVRQLMNNYACYVSLCVEKEGNRL